MAPLTKDSLEIANSTADSAVSRATTQSKPAAGHMRSDALSLEVAVRVHGSKVKDVVLGTTPHTEPFEEQTSTMIIFPQGGVLRMNTAVNVGQMLVLTNLKSRQDAICRVVKVRPNANLASYIEMEFTQRQPGFWGVHFPSDTEAAPTKPAATAPPVATGSALKEKPASDISWTSAPSASPAPLKPLVSDSKSIESKPIALPPPVERFVPVARPEPSFISIGSQEEVQPAASATAETKSKHEDFVPPPPQISAPIGFPSASPAAPPATLSMTDLRGDDDPAPLVAALSSVSSVAEEEALARTAAPTIENSRSTFGSFAGGNTLAAAHSSTSEDFGARLDSGFGSSAADSARPGVNWMLIAAGAVVLLTVLGGGLYFRNRSTINRAASGNPTVTAQPPAQSAPPASSYSAPSPVANSVAQPSSALASSAAPVNPPNAAISQPNSNLAGAVKPPAPAASQPVAIAKPAAPKVTPGMMSQSLNSRPATAQRADSGGSDAAPVLDAPTDSDGTAAALSGLSSSPRVPALAPPAIQPEGPVKIGGDVKEPRLISSALPVYPIGARQSGVEGDVVVKTTIDKSGNVVGMKIVSGPILLRQAALDALHRWKYEPSKLNGQPVAVELQVTIKFRH
jgi:periplasmic protein TonB